MRTIRVAVAGLGFVGRQTVRLLEQNRAHFASRLGASVELAAVCDREVRGEARALRLARSVLRARRPADLLRLPRLDIVVELLGGLEAPRALVVGALKAGRHVVTANKRLLSECWGEIQAASSRGGGRLYFEASVAGGIPLLQSLDSALAANRIEAVYGILNGTTNYILTRAEEGLSAAEALREAQRLGLAEKDPSLDLSGRDTAQKVSVLSSLITGSWIKTSRIACQGIESIERADVCFAREKLGMTARLIGTLRLSWKRPVRVEAHVFPTLVPLGHPLASVRGEYNAVMVQTSEASDLMFYGKGAGPKPAASAVVGDIFMLSRDILGGLPAQRPCAAAAEVSPVEDSVSPYYLRLAAQDRPGVLSRIAASLGRRGISIASIHQEASPGREGVPVTLTTHPAAHGRFRAALGEILRLDAVSRRHAAMRILA